MFSLHARAGLLVAADSPALRELLADVGKELPRPAGTPVLKASPLFPLRSAKCKQVCLCVRSFVNSTRRGIKGGGGFWRGRVRRFCRGNGGRRGGCWNVPRSRGRPADGRALFDGDWPCHSMRLRPCAWLQSPYQCSASGCDPQTTCATDSQSPPPLCTRYRNTADNPEGYGLWVEGYGL